jgi:hypothetical protein
MAKTSRTEGEQVFAKEKGWIELGRLQAKVSSIAECNMYQHSIAFQTFEANAVLRQRKAQSI